MSEKREIKHQTICICPNLIILKHFITGLVQYECNPIYKTSFIKTSFLHSKCSKFNLNRQTYWRIWGNKSQFIQVEKKRFCQNVEVNNTKVTVKKTRSVKIAPMHLYLQELQMVQGVQACRCFLQVPEFIREKNNFKNAALISVSLSVSFTLTPKTGKSGLLK